MYTNRIRIRPFYQYLCDLQLSKMNSGWRTVNYTDKEVFANWQKGLIRTYTNRVRIHSFCHLLFGMYRTE
jgi:hypothetical protein